MPFFTVIIPTYNRAVRLKLAIESVLQQSFGDWELLIIDDGSTDDTRETVLRYEDSRIKYHWQENKERSSARNKGIDLSTGQYICFLDSDDTYAPNHLEVLHSVIRQTGGELLRVYAIFNKEKSGDKIRQEIPSRESGLLADAETHFVNVVCNPSALCVRREIVDKVRFDEALSLGEDFDFIMRILQYKPIFISVPEHTIIMVEHEDNTLSQQSPEFHQTYIDSLKSILYRQLVTDEKNRNTLMDRITRRYRWMAECHRLKGNVFLYWYYKIFARLSR
ncbi:MAG: glycosyltransferase [Bacteroidia bacterium]|nr:glycosyltransferase [Bacteroidia bacterium]